MVDRATGIIAWARKLVTGEDRNKVLVYALIGLLILTAGASSLFRGTTTPVDLQAETNGDTAEIDTSALDPADILGATISIIDGTVEYKTDGDWNAASVGLDITPGMSIRTVGAASRTAVEIDDNSIVRLDASTEVLFETLTESRILLVQDSGYIYHRVASSGSRIYGVQSKNAQYQVEGTAFRTAATGDEESIEIFHGSVKDVTQNITGTAGDKIIVKSFADPSKDGTTQPLSLQAIKDDRFITWNRSLDLENDTYKTLLGFLADYEGPVLTISDPTPSSSITLGADATKGVVQIKGSTESSAQLTVRAKSIQGSSAVSVKINDDGSFVTPELAGPLGNSVFEFVATDAKGNKTWQTVSYIFEKETVTQEQGIILTVDDTSDADSFELQWGLIGMTTPDGVYILSGDTPGLTYPENALQRDRGSSFGLFPAEDYTDTYFSVCRYDESSDSCDVYSNELMPVVTP